MDASADTHGCFPEYAKTLYRIKNRAAVSAYPANFTVRTSQTVELLSKSRAAPPTIA